jgi:hypothetical protein
MICLKAIRCDAHDPNRRRSVRATFQILLLLSIAVTHAAHAENGRDFSAMYDLTNIAPVDTMHVSLTLVLRLQNHSGAALNNATVVLSNKFSPSASPQTVASRVNVADRRSVKVSGTITVRKSEYARWHTGTRPSLVVHFVGKSGRGVDRPVELARMAGLGARP